MRRSMKKRRKRTSEMKLMPTIMLHAFFDQFYLVAFGYILRVESIIYYCLHRESF